MHPLLSDETVNRMAPMTIDFWTDGNLLISAPSNSKSYQWIVIATAAKREHEQVIISWSMNNVLSPGGCWVLHTITYFRKVPTAGNCYLLTDRNASYDQKSRRVSTEYILQITLLQGTVRRQHLHMARHIWLRRPVIWQDLQDKMFSRARGRLQFLCPDLFGI